MSQGPDSYDAAVIGAGLAGLAAALFAARAGLSVVVCGAGGGLDHSSGLIDLLAVHPLEDGRVWSDPWAGLKALVRDCPDHPYARLDPSEIEQALEVFGEFMTDQGLPYLHRAEGNSLVITPAGTIKPSYLIPQTVWPGVEARLTKAPTLIVGFTGLKGFSAKQIQQGLGDQWPGLDRISLPFPGKAGELYPEHLALALTEPETRQRLAARLGRRANEVDFIGFPAVLGLKRPLEVIAHLEELTGARVFEIPTLPPSLAGARLRAALSRGLSARGVRTFFGQKALAAERLGDRGWRLGLGTGRVDREIRARGVILASGRFLGQGLRADRRSVREPLFDLPVSQPRAREAWTGKEFFNPAGHPIFSVGLAVDDRFRPLDTSGRPAAEGLHAAGAILSGNDWTRRKCGGGLALASAWKAAVCLAEDLKGGRA